MAHMAIHINQCKSCQAPSTVINPYNCLFLVADDIANLILQMYQSCVVVNHYYLCLLHMFENQYYKVVPPSYLKLVDN